jgi:hypothetical protein
MRQRETAQFVQQVAEFLKDRSLVTDTNVKKVDGERIARENGQDLTDVDVLAADTGARVIYALECKDLEGARTPAELDNELRSTFRSGSSPRSAADKHEERVAWLAGRIPRVLRHLGVADDPGGWQIYGAIVTDVHVLSPYVTDCPLPVYSWTELDGLVAANR